MAARRVWSAVVAGLALLVAVVVARAEPNYPAFTAPVVDAAHVLSEGDKAAITRDLLDLQTKTGVQFAVATVPSLDGGDIETYANGLFRKWKLGQKDVNNGLLLILAPKERKLRFEVGYGLEGTFTDVQSKLILHNTMVPKLKAGDPAGALKAGVADAILVLTKDKASLPARLKPSTSNIDLQTVFIVFFFAVVIFIIVMGRIRRRGGAWFIPVTGGSSSWSSDNSWSSSSSSSGDSFSGGGGGDSGGGGSSDSY